MPQQDAYIFNIKQKRISHHRIPIPEPQPNQLVLQIHGSGLCHSDVHVRDHHLPLSSDNFIGGHEIAGKVVKIGTELTKTAPHFALGQRYAVHSMNACFNCDDCLSGFPNLCQVSTLHSYGLGGPQGGWQQFAVISNLHSLVRIPDNVSYELAAVTSDAVLTPYHAIKRARLGPTSNVLLIGAGGLGMNAIQIVKAFGAHLVVLDLKQELQQAVLERGADEFYTDMKEYSKSNTTARSFDFVLDLCGFDSTYAIAIRHVKRRGIIGAIGLGYGYVKVNLMYLCRKEVTLLGNFYGSVQELKECLELVSKGLVTPEISMVEFKDVNSVVDLLRDGKIKGRAVFDPNKKLRVKL